MHVDNKQTRFYTGLPSFTAFQTLLYLISPVISATASSIGSSLFLGDQLLFALTKFRLVIPNQDLAYQFGIHFTKASKILHLWIDALSVELKSLITWPDC